MDESSEDDLDYFSTLDLAASKSPLRFAPRGAGDLDWCGRRILAKAEGGCVETEPVSLREV